MVATSLESVDLLDMLVPLAGIDYARIREIFATLILLRWIDQVDTQQSLEAIFEDRPYQELLPPELEWRHWCDGNAQQIGQALVKLSQFVSQMPAAGPVGAAAQLPMLAEPLSRILKTDPVYLADAVHWLAAQSFETIFERKQLLEIFDSILAETASPYDGEHFTPPAVTRLVAALAEAQPSERVLDPCFGRAGFLVAAWQRAENRQSGSPRRPGPILEISGVELNASAFLIGLTRLVLAGVDAPRLALGNSLERDAPHNPTREGFDVVLANPPIGGKTSRDTWRYHQFPILTPDMTGLFVQQALAQLKPLGRAVIVVPDGFLFRGGAERELRRQLIEQGQIEAVVGLPAGVFLPYTGIKGSLLLLRKHGKADRVRMIDAAAFFEPAKGKKPALLPALLAEQLALMVRNPSLPGSEAARAMPSDVILPGTGRMARSVWEVSSEELAAADWDLQPRRRDKGGLDQLLVNLNDAMAEQGKIVPLSQVAKVVAGRSIRSRDLSDEPLGDRAVGYVRIKDLIKGKVGQGSSWVQPLAQAGLDPASRLMPGDVLLSRSGTIGKTGIVRNGAAGAVAANGLYVIRVEQSQLDPNFLMAYLSSPACQNWLAAQRRGAAIQHLNRDVLDRLPVPLPPLPLQVRAASQFQEYGIDTLEFLARALGARGQDKLTPLLSELVQMVPTFVVGLDEIPNLKHLRPILDGVRKARNSWVHSIDGFRQDAHWLTILMETIQRLQDVGEMPRGASLLSVVQEAERGFVEVLGHVTGHLPEESQARALAEKLRDWMRAVANELVADVRIRVVSEVSQLKAGETVELTLSVLNEGALPLRGFLMLSQPDWGALESGFLPERGSLPLTLRGDAPKVAGVFSLKLEWAARALDGSDVNGDVQLSFEVTNPDDNSAPIMEELGGSPYVTGSPLDPKHGNEVFYGREDLIQRIARQVTTQGNVVLLEGNRRAGKTSILRHLEGKEAVPGWLAVYASLQGAEGATDTVGVPTASVFREIAGSLAAALVRLKLETPLPDGNVIAAGGKALGIGKACREGISNEAPFVDFREYLDVVLNVLEKQELCLLLMLDEFDKIQEGIDHGVTSPQVPENIRFLIQTYARFSAILTGSRRLKRLREEYWSALYGLGTSVQVTALDADDARRVVVEPVRGKLTFSPEAVDRVLAITARQPYLLQCLCNRIFDFAASTRSRSITLGSVEEAAIALVKDNEHFASLWDYAAQGDATGRCRRQYLLFLCSESFRNGVDVDFGGLHETLAQHGIEIGDEALAADLEYLRELDLVEFTSEQGDGRYRLAIPMMADWIDQQHDQAVVQSRALAEAEEESA
jgi:type I restriction enzyme M protein